MTSAPEVVLIFAFIGGVVSLFGCIYAVTSIIDWAHKVNCEVSSSRLAREKTYDEINALYRRVGDLEKIADLQIRHRQVLP